jgi:small ubiquitin-related modifier
MDAYASRKGIDCSALRFLFDGHRLREDETPKMLEMEENDQIHVMLSVVGGR